MNAYLPVLAAAVSTVVRLLVWYALKRRQLNFLQQYDQRHVSDPGATAAMARAIGAASATTPPAAANAIAEAASRRKKRP